MTLEKAFNLWIEAVGTDFLFFLFAFFNVVVIIAVFIKRFYPIKYGEN